MVYSLLLSIVGNHVEDESKDGNKDDDETVSCCIVCIFVSCLKIVRLS